MSDSELTREGSFPPEQRPRAWKIAPRWWVPPILPDFWPPTRATPNDVRLSVGATTNG